MPVRAGSYFTADFRSADRSRCWIESGDRFHFLPTPLWPLHDSHEIEKF